MNNKISIVLVDAGNRGSDIFGKYALDSSHRAKFVAVVEPPEERRSAFAQAHAIPPARQFTSITGLF